MESLSELMVKIKEDAKVFCETVDEFLNLVEIAKREIEEIKKIGMSWDECYNKLKKLDKVYLPKVN